MRTRFVLTAQLGLTLGAALASAQAPVVEVVHAFESPVREPTGGLVEGRGGWLYGLTSYGGHLNAGAIYRIDREGRFEVVQHLGEEITQALGSLYTLSDGRMRGVGVAGSPMVRGVVFEIPDGGGEARIVATTASPPGGEPQLLPNDALVFRDSRRTLIYVDAEGAVNEIVAPYFGAGTRSGEWLGFDCGQAAGSFLRLRTNGQRDLSKSLGPTPCPRSPVVPWGSDAVAYVAEVGRSGPFVVSVDREGAVAEIARPQLAELRGFALAEDGLYLIGDSANGAESGTELTHIRVDGSQRVVSRFPSGPWLASSRDNVVASRGGQLFGASHGAVVRFDARGAHPVVELSEDRTINEAALLAASDGAIYGVSRWDGNPLGRHHLLPAWLGSSARIFRIDPDGSFRTLHDFDIGVDGPNPRLTDVRLPTGISVGLTALGGKHGGGFVFGVTPDARVVPLDDPRAGYPSARTFRVRGEPFGVTTAGWNRASSLYRFAKDGRLRVMRRLGVRDRIAPWSIVATKHGAMFGLEWVYDPVEGRVVTRLVRLSRDGRIARVADSLRVPDLANVWSLLPAPAGLFAIGVDGVWGSGGALRTQLWRVDPRGQLTRVHTFSDPSMAAVESYAVRGASLVVATANRTGFEIDASGGAAMLPPHLILLGREDTVAVGDAVVGASQRDWRGYSDRLERVVGGSRLQTLQVLPQGQSFCSRLVLGRDGAAYGQKLETGPKWSRVVFRVQTDGRIEDVASLDAEVYGGDQDGSDCAPLAVGADGSMLGTTASGGPRGGGVLFRVRFPSRTVAPSSRPSAVHRVEDARRSGGTPGAG